MKENLDIDELLNGYIDGELTHRQHTEVQRLIAHDERVAERLRELQKCKILVSSLPVAEAPAETLEEVRAAMEAGTLSAQQAEVFDEQETFHEREGARHLRARRLLTAAAMIGLIAVLGTLVYTIVVPEKAPDKPIISIDWKPPPREIEVKKLQPRLAATPKESTSETRFAAMQFNGRLELRTGDVTALDAFIKRAIENNGLKVSPGTTGDKNIYALSCSREALSLFLVDLESIWPGFDSATLFVETDHIRQRVAVDSVTAAQIAEIVKQESFEKRIKVAKDFAVLNNMVELLPAKEILAAIDDSKADLITIPKPLLTSGEQRGKEPAIETQEQEKVNLTIALIAAPTDD